MIRSKIQSTIHDVYINNTVYSPGKVTTNA